MQQLVSNLSGHSILQSSNEDSQRERSKSSSRTQTIRRRFLRKTLDVYWKDKYWSIDTQFSLSRGETLEKFFPVRERERRKSKVIWFERWPLPFDWKALTSIFLLHRLELVNRPSHLPRKLKIRSRSTIAGLRSIVTIIMFFIQSTGKVVNHRPDVSLSIHPSLEHPRKAFNSVLPLLPHITDNNAEMNKQRRTWILRRIWLNISPNNLHWRHSTVIHRFSSATVSSNRTKRRFSMHSNNRWSTEKNQRPTSIDMEWTSLKMDPSGLIPIGFFIPRPSYSIEILSAKNCIFRRRVIVDKPSTTNLLSTNTPTSSNIPWSSTTWIRQLDNNRLKSTTTNTCVLNWFSNRDSKEEIFVKSNECKTSFPLPLIDVDDSFSLEVNSSMN